MEHYFQAKLTAYFDLTDEEFNLLFNACSSHNDTALKMATEQGGFMYGLKNRRDFAREDNEPDNEVEFTFRQIDKLMKALECRVDEMSCKLFFAFNRILLNMNNKSAELNKSLAEFKYDKTALSDENSNM